MVSKLKTSAPPADDLRVSQLNLQICDLKEQLQKEQRRLRQAEAENKESLDSVTETCMQELGEAESRLAAKTQECDELKEYIATATEQVKAM